MGLKQHYPDITFAGNRVTPDEMDRYEIVSPENLTTANAWLGTAVGTSTQTPTYGVICLTADWPRNLRAIISCASGSTAGGTITATGKDQFGNTITESLGIAVAANGGTVEGTKVFSQVSSAAVSLGTMNAGNGTVSLGLGITGTTALIGLPCKIASTADVKLYTWLDNGTAVAVNGGTVGSFVDTTNHAIKAAKTIGGTSTMEVWVRSSFNSAAEGVAIANL